MKINEHLSYWIIAIVIIIYGYLMSVGKPKWALIPFSVSMGLIANKHFIDANSQKEVQDNSSQDERATRKGSNTCASQSTSNKRDMGSPVDINSQKEVKKDE